MIIMSLTVYTKNNCIQCKMTKKFLKAHGVAFEDRNISDHPEYVDYLKEQGFQSVPVVERDAEPVVNGFRPDLLQQVIAE